MHTIVVGAGVGGLSIAALLAKQGDKITIFEKNLTPGGRARIYKEDGFTFDMGPSWYLMPDIYENFWAEFDQKSSDFYDLIRLDPSYRVWFGDGSNLRVSSGLEKNIDLFNRLERDGGKKLYNYLKSAAEHYRIASEELLYRDYDNLRSRLDGRLLLEGFKLPLFGSIDSMISGIFASDKARRLLEYSIGFVGGSPSNTPALYYIMNHVDFNLGVWYPQGGMIKIVDALVKLTEEYGVEIKYGAPVSRISTLEGEINGVFTSEGFFEADRVIVNADYPHAELELLDEGDRSLDSSYWDKRELTPSALVIYIGLEGSLGELEHHNLYLAGDWSKEFNSLFNPDEEEWPGNVSYYVNVTSRTDPSVSSEGYETLFILIPIPHTVEDTSENRESWYKRIISHVEETMGVEINGRETVKRIFGPTDFRVDYNAYKATSLSLVHTLRQSALFRPSHRSSKVKGLYYTGHYTHPGIGVPLVLISSQILAQYLLNTK